jgi:yeast amino acid transporter
MDSSQDVTYRGASGNEKAVVDQEIESDRWPRRASVAASVKTIHDTTHRKLKPRHIQLIGIGGTIGTALYVQIGKGLLNGGPGSLFLAFTIW